ncbi:MAG: TerB family tellurite resistance protein [Cyclobacteriaceae bacterium]
MEYELKKQLNLLIQLAKSDNYFSDSEKETILRIGKEHGAEKAEVEILFESNEIKESLAPMTLTAKMDFLLDCIVVLMADAHIEEAEEKFAKQTACKLGFKEEVITFLINYQGMDKDTIKDLMVPYLIHN